MNSVIPLLPHSNVRKHASNLLWMISYDLDRVISNRNEFFSSRDLIKAYSDTIHWLSAIVADDWTGIHPILVELDNPNISTILNHSSRKLTVEKSWDEFCKAVYIAVNETFCPIRPDLIGVTPFTKPEYIMLGYKHQFLKNSVIPSAKFPFFKKVLVLDSEK